MSNPKPINSVSVLFIYKEKIFAVQRQSFLKAFPGYHAFPGGKVDKNESSKFAVIFSNCKNNEQLLCSKQLV